jgi:NADPH:quinone reductase-like Zn-dependent oxidoreductase
MLLGPLLSRFSSKQMGVVMYKPMVGLDFLLELIEADRLGPVIDRQYPLTEIADAFRYYGDGNARGKVVIIP